MRCRRKSSAWRRPWVSRGTGSTRGTPSDRRLARWRRCTRPTAHGCHQACSAPPGTWPAWIKQKLNFVFEKLETMNIFRGKKAKPKTNFQQTILKCFKASFDRNGGLTSHMIRSWNEYTNSINIDDNIYEYCTRTVYIICIGARLFTEDLKIWQICTISSISLVFS